MKQSHLWRLEKCDVPINAWEARSIQFKVLDAVRECLSRLVDQLRIGRIDDDAKDERDEEVVLGACFFLHGTASPGASPLR